MNTIELIARLKAAAEKASYGEWVKESGDGWEAACSANDQANSGFIIAHFEGPDAAPNRKFVQAANPVNILALVEALEHYKSREERVTNLVRDNSKSWDELYRQVEAKDKRNAELVEALEARDKQIAELEAREVVLPRAHDVHPLGPQSAKIFCEFHRSIVNRCADEIRKVGVKVSIKGN